MKINARFLLGLLAGILLVIGTMIYMDAWNETISDIGVGIMWTSGLMTGVCLRKNCPNAAKNPKPN